MMGEPNTSFDWNKEVARYDKSIQQVRYGCAFLSWSSNLFWKGFFRFWTFIWFAFNSVFNFHPRLTIRLLQVFDDMTGSLRVFKQQVSSFVEAQLQNKPNNNMSTTLELTGAFYTNFSASDVCRLLLVLGIMRFFVSLTHKCTHKIFTQNCEISCVC